MPKLKTQEPAAKKAVGRSTKPNDDDDNNEELETTGKGWGAVANKKAINDEAAKAPKNQMFMLKDGEEANIQFLDDDPYSFMAHQLQIENRWKTIPCQLEKQRHCTLCDDGSKPIWRAAFRVLDSRGAWDKDKGKFKYDAPVERLWMVNATVANQIKVKHDKKGTLLTNVWTVTRSGSGKHDTSYNIERAVDDNDVPMKAVKHTPVMQDAEDILVPPSDKGLQGMGYSSRKANSAPAKKRKVEEDADID